MSTIHWLHLLFSKEESSSSDGITASKLVYRLALSHPLAASFVLDLRSRIVLCAFSFERLVVLFDGFGAPFVSS